MQDAARRTRLLTPGSETTREGAFDAAGAPVDRAHLTRYTLGDPVLEREIFGLFLAQVPLTVESLRFSATDKEWHMAAHALKGSARAIGAWKLAHVAHEAERAGLRDEAANAATLARIEEAAAEVEAYLDQFRAGSPS